MTLPKTCENENEDSPTENGLASESRFELNVCNICNKKFQEKENFMAHLKLHDLNSDDLDKNEMGNTCNICSKRFTAKKNLLKHLRVVHKNYSEAEKMVIKKMKCPESNCKFMCRMMKELRNHIEASHGTKILKDVLQFPCPSAFQKWKKKEESSTISWFVTGRKKSVLTDGTKKQILYCHRSGHYSPKGFGKYKKRSVGSCKIGVTCPAAMEITESEGGLTVTYYKTHLGHLQEVVYLKLTSEERAQLADKIKQGFSFDAILEDIKEREDDGSEKKKRIQLLSKKNLYSIMQRNKSGTESRKSNSESSQQTVTQTTIQSKCEVTENNISVESIQSDLMEEETPQNLALYTYYLPSQDQSQEFNVLTQWNGCRDITIPQSSVEGLPSQVVFLSPNTNTNPVSEIILLPPNNTYPVQPVICPQEVSNDKQLTLDQVACTGEKEIGQILTEHKIEVTKSNLYVQLEKKLNKISENLPQCQHLTPKQYDLINRKLDAVLNMFNLANEKALLKKQTLRGKKKSARKMLHQLDH